MFFIAAFLLLQPPSVEQPALPEDKPQPAAKTILFLEVLTPMNSRPEETLQFIRQKKEEAGVEFNLYWRVSRLEKIGKNQYGLNGGMAAMIDQLNYFIKEYTLEQIFKAYLQYSGKLVSFGCKIPCMKSIQQVYQNRYRF